MFSVCRCIPTWTRILRTGSSTPSVMASTRRRPVWLAHEYCFANFCRSIATDLAPPLDAHPDSAHCRSEEHTSELQSLMRISYAVFCLQPKSAKKKNHGTTTCIHPPTSNVAQTPHRTLHTHQAL